MAEPAPSPTLHISLIALNEVHRVMRLLLAGLRILFRDEALFFNIEK